MSTIYCGTLDRLLDVVEGLAKRGLVFEARYEIEMQRWIVVLNGGH